MASHLKECTYIYLLFITPCTTLLLGRINIGRAAENRERSIRNSAQTVMELQIAFKCRHCVCVFDKEVEQVNTGVSGCTYTQMCAHMQHNGD